MRANDIDCGKNPKYQIDENKARISLKGGTSCALF